MEIFRYKKNIDFMRKSKLSMIFSFFLILSSLYFLTFKGLNYGVDFAGGTIIQIKYNKNVKIPLIREKLNKNNIFKNISISQFGSSNEIIIKMKKINSNINVNIGNIISQTLKDTGDFKIRRINIVGPKVGKELRKKGVTSILITILGILIYISFRFEWRFATASILALFHDVIITLGIVSLFQIEVNLDVVAAILTILGYSLNDTIIVFDRIREGIKNIKEKTLKYIINNSITKTLSRTFLTSLTTFFVVFTLFIFGGEIIKPFAFTLLIGIIIGTYSSIFVASPFLIFLKFDLKKYQIKCFEAEKNKREREKLRSKFEGGIV